MLHERLGEFLALSAFIASVIALAFLVRGRSLRTLTGSTVTIAVAAFVVALVSVGWALLGIDSTRAVSGLPEAGIVFPEASETRRDTRPARADLFGREGATLDRAYETSASYGDIVAFYARELTARGWFGGKYYGVSSSEMRMYHWARDDYTYFVDIPTGNLAAGGSFRVRIIAPPP